MQKPTFFLMWTVCFSLTAHRLVDAQELNPQKLGTQDTIVAGTAKVDITDYDAGPVNDPLFCKVLVLKSAGRPVVLLTVDAVSIGEIGRIGNDFLPALRKQLNEQLGIPSNHVLVNASHCHGVIQRKNLEHKIVKAVASALENLEQVSIGVGNGSEKEVQENRRLTLKSGKVIDVRHAYSLPADDQVASVGPIDPQIGILRMDRMDGSTKAIVYNFACHPIQSVPNGANTADMIGYASKVIETGFGKESLALFVQGCGGDINPIDYKDVNHPRHAETLGNRLGLATLVAAKKIRCTKSKTLKVLNEKLTLPRGDRTERIRQLETEKERLANSLGGTSLNLKNFMALMVKYKLSPDYPSANAHRYLQQELLQNDHLKSLDRENIRNLKAYLRNIETMESLTRLNTNLRLLKKHQASFVASGKRTVDVEIGAWRVGDFKMITFPGELTVQIGLNLKKQNGEGCLVAGYTNGYINYCPTVEQMKNLGGAQEDSDCILAPAWQEKFEAKAAELFSELAKDQSD